MDRIEVSPRLLQSLEELSKLLLTEDSETTLNRVVMLSAQTIDGCDSAGLTIEQHGKLHAPICTDEVAFQVDKVQFEAKDGPCVEAVHDGELHKIDVIADETRWPRFREGALAAGILSSLSIPLKVDGTVGALNLYSRTAYGFTDADVHVGRQFAAQAAVSVANALVYAASQSLAEQLNEALQSRDLIGRAKGILMEREGIGDDEAFHMLKTISQQTNIKLRQVAEQLVAERAKS